MSFIIADVKLLIQKGDAYKEKRFEDRQFDRDEDWSKNCRLCAIYHDPSNMTQIFCDDGNSLADRIATVTNLEVRNGDGFPTSVCSNCISQLNLADNFIQKCIAGDAVLRTNLFRGQEDVTSRELPTASCEIVPADSNLAVHPEAGNWSQHFIKTELGSLSSNYDSDGQDEPSPPPPCREPWQVKGEPSEPVDRESPPPVADRYDCASCSASFRTKRRLRSHVVAESSCGQPPSARAPSLFACRLCKTKLGTRSELDSHMERHRDGQLCVCPVCGKPFAKGVYLKKHMAVHSEQRRYQCHLCDKSFTQGSSRKEHMRVHTGEGRFKCAACVKSFAFRSALDVHARVHTKERPYACDVCAKRFPVANGLREHMRAHNGERPFACDACAKTFVYRCSLKKHLLVHSGERPYPCALCGKAFRCGGARREHMATHARDEEAEPQSGAARHACGVCGRVCATGSVLAKHARVHTGERPFKCAHCQKSFRYTSSRAEHVQKVHLRDETAPPPAEVRRFECGFCKKKFSKGNKLVEHVRIHTGERPFKCQVCLKTFKQGSYLKTHMRVHTGERPYKCGVCDKAFKSSCTRNEHELIHSKAK